MLDETGRVVWAARYDAWGGVRKLVSGEVDQPLRLQGQYFDAETGLSYNRFRYYCAEIGSFVSQDPLGLVPGENVYAFGPNIHKWIDPLGLCKEGTRSTVDDFIKTNVNPNFQQNVKNAFTSDAKVTTLTKDLKVYRYHGGTSSGKSYWYTPNLTSNPAADLALPAGNTYKYVDTYIIPKGTTILEGTVAPNFGQPGGGYQIYVPDPTVVIPK